MSRAPAQRSEQYHEKHRAPARAPRAGVYGGSAPDAARVIRAVGGQGALAPGNAPATFRAQGLAEGCPLGQTRQNERGP